MEKSPSFRSLFFVLFALAIGVLGTVYVLQEVDFRKKTRPEYILSAEVLDLQLRQLGIFSQFRLEAVAVKTCECLEKGENEGLYCAQFTYNDPIRDNVREYFQLKNEFEVDLKINQLHFSLLKKNCTYPKLDSLFGAKIQHLHRQ
ncbi:hypothetical protein SapgrDRAFT_1928 [Saprospira grandis DSM 2844]|uniref:Uncharacterized protein n=1 Tax=Saprospira grandis DSM 2844 TaxID=694433 RepID=J1I4I2_9BACT|nr:hypothetical protein [Saprospira grandis]EJF53620.1 hypothetical protein SapgrDRAFT_1928 [Saprospira grandis DSM 2844]